MRKVIILMLGIIFLLSTIFGCSNNAKASVWCALSSETFLLDSGVSQDKKSELNLYGIKGETESGQIIVTANKDISFVDISVSDLKDSKGNIIKSSFISVYAEKYVEIVSPYINSGTTRVTFPAVAGFYPDALLPFDLYKSHGENNIVKGNNQGFWFDVKIPLTITSGEYSGAIELLLDKSKFIVPITLKVYDLEMPEEVHSRTAMNIWHTQLEYGEKSNYDENTNQIYFDYLLEKRLCSSYVPINKRQTLDDFVEYMVDLSINPKVTSYKIWNYYLGIDDTTHLSLNAPSIKDLPTSERQQKHELACNQAYNGIKTVFSKMLNKTLEKSKEYQGLDLYKKAIFHFEDEPSRGYRTERTKKFNEILTKAKKDFVNENLQVFNEYPYLKESLLNSFRDITPTDILDSALTVSEKEDGTPDYDKGDGVTLWCVHCYKVESSAARKIIKERQAYGEEFWWYNCARTSPAPSFYLEAVTMNIRLQSWQQYEHGFKGMLYWDVVHWQELPDCDPFKSLQYGSYGSGEGILLYPGYKYGVKTPISSIRLENIFQGQEDYEYLYLLNGYIENYNLLNGTKYSTQELVASLIKDLHSGSYLKEKATAKHLEECRIKILDLLELFANGQTSSAIFNIDKLI